MGSRKDKDRVRKPKKGSHASNNPNIEAIQKPTHRKQLSSLQQKMRKKLDSANFRMLNESMYTTTGAKARSLMSENPELFQIYHTGYVEQVRRWPRNPLDDIIQFLSTQKNTLRVADLGCGEARLSRQVPQAVKSFDLVAVNEHVTACDIAKLPLQDASIDVAIFCLSLMGTNYGDFLQQAQRVVIPSGIVVIAEVASRFPDHDPTAFIRGVESTGFTLDPSHPLMRREGKTKNSSKRRGGKRKRPRPSEQSEQDIPDKKSFFFTFVFRKKKTNQAQKGPDFRRQKLPSLAPCAYKRR